MDFSSCMLCLVGDPVAVGKMNEENEMEVKEENFFFLFYINFSKVKE